MEIKIPNKGIVQGKEFTAEDELFFHLEDGEPIVEIRTPDNRPWWRKWLLK